MGLAMSLLSSTDIDNSRERVTKIFSVKHELTEQTSNT